MIVHQRLLTALALGLTLPIIIPAISYLKDYLCVPPYTVIEPSNQQQLTTVFFSGQPHLIFCVNSTGKHSKSLKSNYVQSLFLHQACY